MDSTLPVCLYGVTQGSILAPVLFALYMLTLGSVFKKHKVLFHCFADDVQIYLPVTANDNQSAVKILQDCLREVQAWLRLNFLNLYKTEILVFGQSDPLHGRVIGPLSSYCRPFVKNLGVMVDTLT